MISTILSLLLFVTFSIGSPAIAPCAEPQFDVRPDGSVLLDNHHYGSMTDYYTSPEFRANGKRCGTKSILDLSTSVESHLADGKDCSANRTVIRDKYWPRSVYTIPIVFHIIQKEDGTGNIPDSRIYNQVAALNEDYRAVPGSPGEAGFDSHIQFELAGITRTTNDLWFNDKREMQYKTALGWSQKDYLNVYVNSASGYLGYSYYPQEAAGSVWDGVVILYDACGGRNEGSPPYDQGRTLTHEVGHYLGLLHTFEGGCGTGYTHGDLIEDTNPEKIEHYYCKQTNTCNTPDPIHNYMNYTPDTCMLEVTAEQSNRAVCSLLNYRPDLYHIDGGASEKEIFVHRITLKLETAEDGSSFARSAITVMDKDGRVVPRALVSIRWSGIVDRASVKTTSALGKAFFASPRTDAGGTFTITTTNVYAASMRYESSLNEETTRSITK